MQLRLWQMGIAPHLLPVDVMNYVMLELGQPLHAFDFATIDRGHVIVRWAHPGELFQGLDGRAYELCSEDLLIADETKPLALAGVLGGAESQITPQTSAVLIESALFHPTSIRRTARRYGLETDAAYRFQRGVDPQGVVPALRRAVQFLVELGAGKLTAAVLVGKLPANSRRIQLRYAQIPRILGISLPSEQVHDVLERLGFRVEGQTPQACTLRVPPFRADVREEIDLIEELARLYGYERIPAADRALLPLESEPIPAELAPPPVRDTLVKVLVEWGLQQVFTPVLLDPETAQQWEEHPVQLVNARGAEFSVLRPSLVPSLARVLSHNVRVGERTVRIFELGKVFRRRGGDGQRLEDYEERLHLGILLSGAAVPLQWGMSPREVDFYDLRGVVEQLLERLRIAAVRWEPWSEGRPQPVLPVALRLFSGEHLLGWVGQLRPRWLRTLEVEQPAFVAILDVEALNACVQPLPWYVPVPEYPAVRRDLAFVVQQEVPVTELVEAIRQAAGEWLEEVTLFDVFVSPAIGEDKRSLAFALRFRSRERTLRDEDVNPIIERIVSEVERRTGAQWRR
jgi:phenylalanyl-tRNA synthetase beta chain